jgi:hypothetical protein
MGHEERLREHPIDLLGVGHGHLDFDAAVAERLPLEQTHWCRTRTGTATRFGASTSGDSMRLMAPEGPPGLGTKPSSQHNAFMRGREPAPLTIP